MMKKWISLLALACCFALVLASAVGCAPSEEPESAGGEGVAAGTAQNDVSGTTFSQVATQGDVVLSINKDNGVIALENRADGTRCISNANDAKTDLERSQFLLTYLDKKGITSTMNTYSDSVKTGQYKIENVDNGAKVTFTCGEYMEELLFPYVIAPTDFEALTDKIEDSFEQLYITSRYKLTDINKVTVQTEKEELLTKYPELANQKLYVLKQDNPNISVRRELHRLFTAVGYDQTAYARDMALVGEKTEEGDPFFTFSVYYTLENGGLKVRIPAAEIVEANGGKLLKLSVLPYMDTPSADIDGQYLLPDGAGSLMYFRNGKQSLSGYEAMVYGEDITNQAAESIVNLMPCYLPVVGCLREDHTLMTYATEGASIAFVRAVSGDKDVSPQAYFEYMTRPHVRTKLASDGAADGFTTVAQELYDGDIVLEYTLFKKGTTYSDLAAVMRYRLFGEDSTLTDPSPLAVNLIGTADEERSLFGIKYQYKNVYTTVEQAASIRDQLVKSIPNVTVRLSGFINGGMQQQLKKGVKVQGGSQEALMELLQNDRTYLSTDALLLRANGLFDAFNADRDVTYTLENLKASYKNYNPATFQLNYEESRYILSADTIQTAFNLLTNQVKKLNAGGVAVNDGASLLGADYDRKTPTNREVMANLVETKLNELSGAALVMVDGANAYALSNANAFANVALTSTKFDVCDESVPFLPMVLCGKVDYFGSSMNTVNNDLTSFLQVVESGAGLYYTITADDDKNFSKTEFDEFFSTKFSMWEEEIEERAAAIQELFEKRGSTIVRHEKLADKVYKTVYDNGFYTVVNYNNDVFEQGDIRVPALSYAMGGIS